MPIITIQYVKERFPRWAAFVRIDSTDDAAALDERLTQIVAYAEAQLLEYVNVTDETISDQLTRHLMNLVRKGCFDVKNAETSFETKPQIVRDYEDTLRQLRDYRAGILGARGEDTKDFVVTAKPRLFGGKWFNPED